MSPEELHAWFLDRSGQVLAYRVESQFQLFTIRPTAMVKLVDSARHSVIVRKAVFERFRGRLPSNQRALLPLRTISSSPRSAQTAAAKF
jgi:hypothetical protein